MIPMMLLFLRQLRFLLSGSVRHLLIVSCLSAGFLPGVVQAEPRILASIKPLALIAQEIAGTEIQVDTLLPITASPHDYPLKMSDHRRLREAALIIWVGPELESFLNKPLRNLAAERLMGVYDLPNIQWPEESVTGAHNHQGRDPHLWLNPQNAVVIAEALVVRLAQLAPEKSAIFAARLAAFVESMEALDKQLNAQMRPLQARGFAVYHEGYTHFVTRYGLRQLGYVTYTPERRPGAKHTHELHQILKQEGVCLFSEPYQEQANLQHLAKELDLRLGQLDPIGGSQVKSYKKLLEEMGQAFSACLAYR